MNCRLYALLALALLACPAIASEWADSIAKVVPAGIALTEVKEADGFVELVGEAKSNDEITALMRAIDQARLGSPELQAMQQANGVSTFVLRVRAPR